MNQLETALYLYDRGLKLFPLKPNSKKPLSKGWQEFSKNCTKETLTKAFEDSKNLCNFGVSCEHSSILVIDIDTKDQSANETIKELNKNGNKLESFTVKTLSGGYHIYFKGLGASTVKQIHKAIDTRGIGGYVVAPGSIIDNLKYKIVKNTEINEIPKWLIDALNSINKKDPITLQDYELIEEGERNKILASLAGTMRRRGMGFEAIHSALIAVNQNQFSSPLSDFEVESVAKSITKYSPETAEAASDFAQFPEIKAISASEINVEKIPPRDWIMKNRFIGSFISVIIAPGGVGKSTLTLLDALSICTGNSYSGFEVIKKGAVWLYNTEDPLDELRRRMAALAKLHNVDLSTLTDLYLSSGREKPLILAKKGQNGVIVNNSAIDSTVAFIKEKNIKLLILDPFVRCHEVSENDNMEIDKVVWVSQRIADKTGCSVCIVHHTRKPGKSEEKGNADTARGASALVNASRISHTLSTMTKKEAKIFGISEKRHSWYVRLDNAKANLNAPAESADWFEKVSMQLDNGDLVGSLKKVELVPVEEKPKEILQDENKEVKEDRGNDYEHEIEDMLKHMTLYLKPGEIKPLDDISYKIISGPSFPVIRARKHNCTELVVNWFTEVFKKERLFEGKVFYLAHKEIAGPKKYVGCKEFKEIRF